MPRVTSSSPTLGRPPLGRPDPALRDRLPRRARRLDGWRRPPVDPGRPRPTTSQLQWVVSAYVLGLGGLLLLGGRAADLLGRRRILIAALSVFTLASLAGGLITDGTLLIAARFLKGAAAAFTVPAALSLITTTFTEVPPQQGARDLQRVRRERLQLRPRVRRPADQRRLAADLPAPRAGRGDPACRRSPAISPGTARRRAAPLRPPGRGAATAGMLVAVHALVERNAGPRRRSRRAAGGSSPSSCGRRSRSCASGSSATGRSCGRTSAPWRSSAPTSASSSSPRSTCRTARLEGAGDRAGLPARRPVGRARRAADGRGDQPLRHAEADPGLHRSRSRPATRSSSRWTRPRTGSRSCRRCC